MVTRSAHRLAGVLAFLLLSLGPALAVQPPSFTLEEVLGAPFPSELLPSPSGGRLAWIQDDRGRRNVWVAEPPDYRGRQLTRYGRDDGQALGGLAWTPDGTTLFYVRGGAANRQGEHPNPTSDPAGAEQAVWRIAVAGGEPVRVGAGSAPAVSPRGDVVAFLRKGQIFRAPVDGSAEPAVMVQTRGASASLRWSPDGSKLAAVTHGEGVEWMPAPLGDGRLAWIQAGARSPARPVIRFAGGEPRDLAPGAVPASFPEDRLVVPQQVVFSGADGLRVHGQLFVPHGLKAGERRPAVIFLHGGSHRQMLLGWHYSPYYNRAYAMNQYLASRGYVVLAVNFRAGIGYGMDFREAHNLGAAGASEFQDVLGAGLYLRSRPDVDPDRIGLWGGSYGGYLTALGLAKASHLFAAGVDIHGVHDWNVGIRNFIPGYDPDPDQERLAFESSPMAWLDGWRSPVLLIHGDDDRNVAFSETVDLAEELRRRDVDVEILVLPDEVHSFLRHASWLKVYGATADFFDRKLGGRGPG